MKKFFFFKKEEGIEKCVIKINLNLKIINFFRSNWIWKLNNPARQNKLDVNSLRKNHGEFIKNNKLILKSQQRLRSQNLNVFILSRLF